MELNAWYINNPNNSYLSANCEYHLKWMKQMSRDLLKQILLDARLSYRKIGEKIGVSPPTVLSRVQKLEKKRIITSYSAILNHEKARAMILRR